MDFPFYYGIISIVWSFAILFRLCLFLYGGQKLSKEIRNVRKLLDQVDIMKTELNGSLVAMDYEVTVKNEADDQRLQVS